MNLVDAPSGMAVVVAFVLFVITLAIAMALIRLVRGPTLADRVVALDLISYLAVGLVAVAAIGLDTAEILQPAMVLAFVAFLGTVAFARYVEKIGPGGRDS